MKKIVCFLAVFSLFYSCNKNNNIEADDGLIVDETSFQYSIIIKDNLNQDLLFIPPTTYAAGIPYPKDFVKITTLSQNNAISSDRIKYENEYRLVIILDGEKEISGDYIEMILELCVALPGCGKDGIYTYDTIRCDIDKENKSIKTIQVNGQLAWEKRKSDIEEPFIMLERELCKGIEICDPAEPIVLTSKQNEKANIDNRFAFSMFKEVSEWNGDNTFFSPLSLNMALGMLYNGASGETRAEMADALGFNDFTETEINEYYQKMSQAMLTIDPLTDLGIANSIWYREGFPVKQPFIDVNKTFFDAAVRSLDFNKPDAAGIINNWCAEKTKDKIKNVIDNQISDNVMMNLINALYFKSEWVKKFKKENTTQEYFTKTDNQKMKVNMMRQTEFFPYYADKYLQCVELPYGNEAFSMVLILPDNDMDIEQLVAYLDNSIWGNVDKNLQTKEISLKLPRFKVECLLPLNEPLMNVGIQRIFFGGFENITNDSLFVSRCFQKTFVEVNEEGTEAAAVTVTEMVTSNEIPPIPFFANRPFLYLIKEQSTGAILFIGQMDEPNV